MKNSIIAFFVTYAFLTSLKTDASDALAEYNFETCLLLSNRVKMTIQLKDGRFSVVDENLETIIEDTYLDLIHLEGGRLNEAKKAFRSYFSVKVTTVIYGSQVLDSSDPIDLVLAETEDNNILTIYDRRFVFNSGFLQQGKCL